jgi:hypothetical protein
MLLMRTLLVSLLVLSLLGCGGSTDSNSQADGTAADATTPGTLKRVDASDLPPLDDYLPPLDEGRVAVAPPAGWHRMPKTATYLCSFTQDRGGRLPAIVVKVSDPTVEGFEHVTEENVAEFAEALQATLNKPIEDARPLVLGTNAFARYVKAARVKNVSAEVQVLATIQNGRMYTVELQVIAKAILAHRDQGYAVGAGLKFEDAASGSPEAAEAAAETPVEKADAPTPTDGK